MIKTLVLLPMFYSTAHFTPVPNRVNEVYHRERDQQARIYDGVEDSKLSWKQFNNLESRENTVNRELARDIYYKGRYLTPDEYWNLNRQLNRISDNIHSDLSRDYR